ncbi:MAG: DDE-type integrase/transposase/recombinase [Deltaproteobacteria bacterium]|jgi:transposase InsO family protein|nr:DDE-type integrase/transposase/recombinase [Deltaproteobacteria bacterium]
MKKKLQKQRALAVQRYLAGESPQSICASLGKTKPWLYKWVSRHTPNDPAWSEEQSRRPIASPNRTPAEIEKIVELVRLNLYNKGLFCGNQAIQWEMSDMEVQPIPSLTTIGRILRRRELTHRRIGRYTPKGKKYPELPALLPNQTHQVDMVGPCYLTGPVKFYSLHAVDTAINRCGIEPMHSRAAQSVLDAVYAIWLRMGIPENLQVDNEMAFFGSPIHPRGMGPLIRLCLHYGIKLWFIPPSEPWWNGVVEKFNDHYQQKFLGRVTMSSMPQLRQESLAFEHRHNSTYRYSKIKGKTPLKALAAMEKKLIFPSKSNAPRHPLDKPEEGCYHLVRFIRSDCRLNIFGEMFSAPPETQYEYVVATVDVKEQTLKLFLDTTQVEEYQYQLR